MDLTQFPTVETLPPQGKSVNELVVAEWSKVKNGRTLFFQESVHWLA
jgi:hypothetical protein